MSGVFERSFVVGWEHLDSNGHMKNTAYLDLCVNTRMGHFQETGFPPSKWKRLHIGPVVMRDDLEYRREFFLLDVVRVTLTLAGSSEDGSRYRLRNEFYRADDKLAATVSSTGGWLDLSTRKLIVPPKIIKTAMDRLVHTQDYVVLPSSMD